MQRAIEEAGIPTIIIAALPPVVRQTGTPRAVAPLVPMGANAGAPNNVEQQTAIVKATLEQLVEIQTPGKIGEGITHTITGVYVILTGVDVNGKQTHEFGSSEGNLKDMLYLNRAGTPGDEDVIISFDVTLAAGMGQERPGPTAAHRACDKFIQSYRDQLKKFKGNLCTERHEYHDIVRPGKKRVLIIKQVAGQGAMYDTHLFAKEPSGVEGGKSIIDMGNMPVILTPNEYRDGIIRSMQ